MLHRGGISKNGDFRKKGLRKAASSFTTGFQYKSANLVDDFWYKASLLHWTSAIYQGSLRNQ